LSFLAIDSLGNFMKVEKSFWNALKKEAPLQVVGVTNAYTAIMAQRTGFQSLYLSGAGIANYSFGVTDTGITTLENVLEEVKRICSVSDLPLLVDIDTGFGDTSMVQKTIKQMQIHGASAVHLEDQVFNKKCGHIPGKKIIPLEEMVEKIQAAKEACIDKDFVIMARSDAYANEGMDGLLKRLEAYIKAGASMIFPEALDSLNAYQKVSQSFSIPMLANLTEFGKTPSFHVDELKANGVSLVLYPLSAARMMNKAALEAYQTIKSDKSAEKVINKMQTREELYDFLNYDGLEIPK
jgi:methylisocitrate lyase